MVARCRVGFSPFPLSIILLFLLSTAVQSACVDDALQRVDRDALLMKSNAVYRVFDGWSTIGLWLPLSKVTICDQVGDIGDIFYEIKNQDDNQMVRAMRER